MTDLAKAARSWRMRIFHLAMAFLFAFQAGKSPVRAGETEPDRAAPYLSAVRRFADQAIVQGRDCYGKPTPLFVDGLDAETGEPVKWKWADGKEWVLCNLAN
jgi:hypothetical protein